jgi:glycyl-tRNA synthetase
MMFEEIMRIAHQRGFFFKAAESYPNSPAGFWDYGPLGVSLKNKFVELWRRELVKRDRMLEIDGSQILPKAVFVASGHLESFSDPVVRCRKCGSFFRPDKLIQEKTGKQIPEKLTDREYDILLEENIIKCSNCGERLSGTRRFNMMFRVNVGAAEEEAYLRPETCQTIFVDFPLLFKTQRIKLPVGIAQVGKSFRNEIAPRQGLLRLREITQAEIEVFFNPRKTEGGKFELFCDSKLPLFKGELRIYDFYEANREGIVTNKLIWYYLNLIYQFYQRAGLDEKSMRFRVLPAEDRAFYSSEAYDLEVNLSVGWTELVACNYRGDYDLTRHGSVSGTDFSVDDGEEKIVPHVFELSMGVDRSIYSILELSMNQESERRYLSLRPYLSPFHVCVFPLVNKDGLEEKAAKIYTTLSDKFDCFYDDSGSIGRRYARADEIGVPFCVTVDYDTLKDNTVTLRDRDTKMQERVKIEKLVQRLEELTSFPGSKPYLE